MSASDCIIEVNGWTILVHPLFIEQLEKITAAVEKARAKDEQNFRKSAPAKLLKQLITLFLETIPADPTRPEYRQGNTLGDGYKHWFRAHLGNQRFRLFFRYSFKDKIIIYAWINDEQTLRAYGAKTDAYAVFKKMLDRGNPPDNYEYLTKQCRAESARLRKTIDRAAAGIRA